MKHNWKITLLLISMFLITQFIGLYVINFYLQPGIIIPFGMGTDVEAQPNCQINSFSDFFVCTEFLPSLLVAFVIAIFIFFILTKFKAATFIKLWFFAVVIIALSLALYAIIPNSENFSLFLLILSIPLAYFKIYKHNLLVHNLTELFIYPGIAVVFIPLLNFWSIIILLILISIYDMWAVWKSGIMQKMAKYQINKLNLFSGFFVPHISAKDKQKFKKMKKNSKNKIKVNIAILGGGDVIFPIITAGVMLKEFGLTAALLVIAGAVFGLTSLFILAEKKKFYPAMPFITIGIFLALIINKFFF